MSEPTGAEIAANIRDALHAIHNPPLPAAVCECGSITAIENHGLAFPGQRNGIYCHRGHRLPGQDMPGTPNPRTRESA